MTINVDNCTSTWSNSSNDTVMHITYDGFLCLITNYIYVAVMCMIILPLNIGAFWLSRMAKTIDKGSESYGLLHLNLSVASVMFCIAFVVCTFLALKMLNNYASTFLSYMLNISQMAQAQFHTWICVEYYLAVVHPIFYLKLKQTWYKIVWVSFTWVTSTVLAGIGVSIQRKISLYLFTIPLSGLILLILFCGMATLLKLQKPYPGQEERRKKLHHQKIKAFKILTLTLVVLTSTYLPNIFIIFFWDMIRPEVICIATSIAIALILPGSVIQPLLYISCFFKAKGMPALESKAKGMLA